MLKGKSKLTAVLLAAALMMIAAGTGCEIRTVPGPDLEKPLIVKELCWFSQDYFRFYYICDYESKEGWRAVKDIQVPALGDAGFTVASQDEGYEKYGLSYVEVILDEPVKKDTVIAEVVITWEDDTKTTAKIGQAVLLAGVTDRLLSGEEKGFDTLVESGGWTEAHHDGEDTEYAEDYAGFETNAARRITGVQLPSKKAWKLIDAMNIDGASNVRNGKADPLNYDKDECYNVAWTLGEGADPYGFVQIPAAVMAENNGKKEAVAVFTITKSICCQEDLTRYLKQVL